MITKSIVLACDQAAAFHLFTARISEWWPPERRHTGERDSTIVLAASGEFYERGSSGQQVPLGAVLAWEPPARLELAWYPGTDPDHPTKVVVSFVPEGPATRVLVEHSATEASRELFPLRAPRYEASWQLVLAALGSAALDNR